MLAPRIPRTPLAFALCWIIGHAAQAAGPAAFADVNAALGQPLFADDNLWDDPAKQAAERLALAPESEGPAASYRLYPDDAARLLGARPWSVSLLSDKDQPSSLSILFANKGDFGGLYKLRQSLAVSSGAARTGARKMIADAEKGLEPAIKADADAVERALVALFGPGKSERVEAAGPGKEKVLRWDWSGHSFLLTNQPAEYAALRILPTALVDADDASVSRKRSAFKSELEGRVTRRPNGDVVLSGLPMVDQGAKGYCVPATMERMLRYMGVPGDMYVLALAGETGAGGGTEMKAMIDALARHLRAHRCQLEKAGISVKINSISRLLEQGLPILWVTRVESNWETRLTERAAQRAATPDADAWRKMLKTLLRGAGRPDFERDKAHARLIIGFNDKTDELAISDSWGPEYAERWITVDEAEELSAKELYVIKY